MNANTGVNDVDNEFNLMLCNDIESLYSVNLPVH